jgi:hypothetical protein
MTRGLNAKKAHYAPSLFLLLSPKIWPHNINALLLFKKSLSKLLLFKQLRHFLNMH